MNILELFARIGLKADTAPAENFDKAVKGIKSSLIGAIAGTLSLAGAVKAVNAAMGEATELKRFGDQTGVNVEEMQKWKAVAEQASGSGAAVASSIDAIVSNQAKIKLGTGNIQRYQPLRPRDSDHNNLAYYFLRYIFGIPHLYDMGNHHNQQQCNLFAQVLCSPLQSLSYCLLTIP